MSTNDDKSFELLSESRLRIVRSCSNADDTLVILIPKIEDDDDNDGSCPKLTIPLYSFGSNWNWYNSAPEVLKHVPRYGVYLCSIIWSLNRKSYEYNDNEKRCYLDYGPILHCVCKEPLNRFQGKIGPINIFVPHKKSDDRNIKGIYVTLVDTKSIHLERPPANNMEHFHHLKRVHSSNGQIMFFASKDSACAGIQVMYPQEEDKRMKRMNRNHHHERPLVIANGFYLLDGIFRANFLNYNPYSGECNMVTPGSIESNTHSSPKIIILGEGMHLIRTTTSHLPEVYLPELGRKLSTKRDIEVCLDFHYKKLMYLDHQQIGNLFRN